MNNIFDTKVFVCARMCIFCVSVWVSFRYMSGHVGICKYYNNNNSNNNNNNNDNDDNNKNEEEKGDICCHLDSSEEHQQTMAWKNKYWDLWKLMETGIHSDFSERPSAKAGGARGVIVIVVGNGHGVTSSNRGRGWLYFTSH